MNFDEYQKLAATCDMYEATADFKATGFILKAMGLAGEAGETVDKIKKIIRDKDGACSDDDRGEIVKELGDVMWYVASIARYLDVSLSEVAQKNVEKLMDRKARGKLHGSGDNR